MNKGHDKGHDKGHKGQMSDREVMQLALEALENRHETWGQGHDELNAKAITALRQALEQPRQECETCANKRKRLEQSGFLKSPLRDEK